MIGAVIAFCIVLVLGAIVVLGFGLFFTQMTTVMLPPLAYWALSKYVLIGTLPVYNFWVVLVIWWGFISLIKAIRK